MNMNKTVKYKNKNKTTDQYIGAVKGLSNVFFFSRPPGSVSSQHTVSFACDCRPQFLYREI